MEDITENKEVQTIGEMLRNARIKQNKTIEEIAEELCIREIYLTAIENMDFDNMPPMPYGLGFVRNYSKLLGLNSDRIVFSYRQIMTGEEEPKPQSENHHPETSGPRPKHFILGILGLALLAVAWSVLPTTSKFEDISEDNSVTVPTPVIVADEEEKPDAQKVKKAEKKKVESDKTEAKDKDKAKDKKDVKDTKEETKESSTQEEKAKEDKKEEKKADEKKAEKAALPKMRIVLTGPSWLELRQDNKVLLNGVYNKGYKYDLPSGKGLIISVGRPRNVQFYLDDKPVQVATNIRRKNLSLDSYFKTQD